MSYGTNTPISLSREGFILSFEGPVLMDCSSSAAPRLYLKVPHPSRFVRPLRHPDAFSG